MVHRLTLTKLSNLANFGCLSQGRVPRWWKFYQFGWNTPQMKIYHNLVPHDLRWRKLNASAWKDAAIRFPVLYNFFLFIFLQCRSSTLGRKTKIRGWTKFYRSFNRKGTLVVPFMFGENVMSRRECLCTELRVPSSLSRFKKDWVIDVESLNGPSSELDNFHFLVSKDGHRRAHLTWRRVISLKLEEKYWRNIFSIFYLKSHQNPMEEF